MYYFIINPKSGNGNASKIWSDVIGHLKHLSIEFEFIKTEQRYHAKELASNAVIAGQRNIICVGGDGTFNEVVNGIMSQSAINPQEINIGMIPTGTGNDWCRSHNIPNNAKDALGIIINGNIKTQDVGKLSYYNEETDDRYFANVAGVGFDAVVANNVNIDKSNGKSGIILFVKNLLKSLINSKTEQCRIYIDGKDYSMKIFTMAVGIGKFNGGGMMQLPNAEINDGLFDITIISDISKFDVLRYAPLLFNGKFIKHPKVFCYQGKEIILESSSAIDIEVEGESAGTLPLKIEILPSALSVFSGII